MPFEIVLNSKERKMINIQENYEKIYNKYFEKLFRTVLIYCKNKGDAEDVIQNTFLKLYISKKVFVDEVHVKNWMFKTAINDATNVLKSKWNNYVPFEESMIKGINFENEDDSKVVSKILKLPKKYRIVLLLYYYDGYSTAEISQILSLNISTVQTRLARARAKLKKSLEVSNE